MTALPCLNSLPPTEDAFQTICRQLSLDSQSLHTPVREDEAIIVAQINQSLTKKSPEVLRSFTQSYEQLSNLVSNDSLIN